MDKLGFEENNNIELLIRASIDPQMIRFKIDNLDSDNERHVLRRVKSKYILQ